MRFLFVNDDFPGHFEALASMFSAMPEHEVFFASFYGRRDFSLPGVRRILLKPHRKRSSREGDELVQEWSRAVSSGRLVLSSFQALAEKGFEPDMILYSSGSGIALFLDRVFPSAFRVAYIDSSLPYRVQQDDPDKSMAAQLVQSTALFQCHKCYAFSPQHAAAMPGLTGRLVEKLDPFIDTEFFRRENASAFRCEGLDGPAELVSIDARNGMGIGQGLVAVVAGLLLHRPESHVLFLCGNENAAQKIRDAFAGLSAVSGRVHALETLKRSEFRDALCASSVFVCPAGAWLTPEKMAAMSCGTPLIAPHCIDAGADAVMLTLPAEPKELYSLLARTLDSGAEMEKLACEARHAMQDSFDQKRILRGHICELLRQYKAWKRT